MKLKLQVNGRTHEVDVSADTPLLDVLRNDLGLSGPKFGCGLGQCGSCTVLLDGELVLSCLRRVSAVADGEVVTVEGLGTRDDPHPLQEAFIAEQALQCGYCTAGMLIGAAALLDAEPDPSEERIREALNRHLCRCGAHERIVRAVRRAARGGERG